jgi:hypothetical protein
MRTTQMERDHSDTRRNTFIDRARTALRKGENLVFDPEDFAELCRIAELSDLTFMPDDSVAFFGCRFIVPTSSVLAPGEAPHALHVVHP